MLLCLSHITLSRQKAWELSGKKKESWDCWLGHTNSVTLRKTKGQAWEDAGALFSWLFLEENSQCCCSMCMWFIWLSAEETQLSSLWTNMSIKNTFLWMGISITTSRTVCNSLPWGPSETSAPGTSRQDRKQGRRPHNGAGVVGVDKLDSLTDKHA